MYSTLVIGCISQRCGDNRLATVQRDLLSRPQSSMRIVSADKIAVGTEIGRGNLLMVDRHRNVTPVVQGNFPADSQVASIRVAAGNSMYYLECMYTWLLNTGLRAIPGILISTQVAHILTIVRAAFLYVFVRICTQGTCTKMLCAHIRRSGSPDLPAHQR